MPKLKNVTNEEISALIERVEDLMADAHDLTSRIEQSYCDPLDKPIEKARTFIAATRGFADLTSKMLLRSALQEQRAEYETLLRNQA